MSQQPPDSKSSTPASEPTLTELSADELDRVTGGDKTATTNKTSTTDFHFTKLIDKASPTL